MLIHKKLNKILVPLDGSKNSLRGLKFALDVAKQSDSSIIGLYVNAYALFAKTLPIKQKSKNILKQAKSMSEKANILFYGVVKVDDNIGKTIVRFAHNHKVDLIVIGSRGTDPHLELFLGSVANYVIHKSKTPVTIIK